MSDTAVLPSWEDLRRDYIQTGLPHRFVVRATPGLQAFTDASAARLGARFELAADAPAAPASMLQQIVVTDVGAEGRRWLEISTTDPRLYESFYRLIGQISAAVLDDIPAHTALSRAVNLWDTLVEQIPLLSEERQAGLFGELLFLERLILAGIPDPVSTWIGPDRQAHDFRHGDVEFEVKTTSGAKRVHTINGLGQLTPSVDCSLYLISLQTTDAGTGGASLPELVDRVRALVPHANLKDLNARLETAGYVEGHRPHYRRRRRLRSNMLMVPILDGAPRLTANALTALPAAFAAERITAVIYDVDVTGLGFSDGSSQFLAVVPPAQGSAS